MSPTTTRFSRDDAESKLQTLKRPFAGPDKLWWLIAMPSFFMALYPIFFLSGHPLGDADENKRIRSIFPSRMHIIFSVLTVGLGPFQFLRGVRTKWPAAHRWLGRAYTVGVVGGGLFGIGASFHAAAYPFGRLVFLVLSVYWLVTMTFGLRSIWRKEIVEHKRWMTRNFALSYAAVMIRWQNPVLAALGFDPIMTLTLTSALSWVPHSIILEWQLQRYATKSSVA